jgi:hypothetical protein
MAASGAGRIAARHRTVVHSLDARLVRRSSQSEGGSDIRPPDVYAGKRDSFTVPS